MGAPLLPTYSFANYPQAQEPGLPPAPAGGPEQLVVYRREERFATCRQHMEQHRREFYKLSLVERGGGIFYLNDEAVEVAPQSVLLVQPGTALRWHLHEGPQTGLYCFFSADFYNVGLLPAYQLHAALPGAAPYAHHACTADEYAALRQSGEQLWAQQQHLEKARHSLRLLLADLRPWQEAAVLPTAEANPLVQQFLQLVDTRLAAAKPALALEPYANALCITSKYLSDLCRQATGQSAATLLKAKVVTEARVLLTGTRLPVSHLAYRLGFYDIAHFSRYFKQAVGQTPTAYRAQFAGYK